MFFLYFSGAVIFNIKYVRKEVIVVQSSVIIESIRGNIELVFIQTEAVWKVDTISSEFDSQKVIITIMILHITHANKLHNEFIVMSDKLCFLGQNDIFYLLSFKILINNIIAHRLIKISAILNIEKYLIPIKSITFQLNTLSIQFHIAHHKINQKDKSINLLFLLFSSLK